MDRFAYINLCAAPPRVEPVTLPNGETDYVRVLNASERDAFDADLLELGNADFRARIIIATVSDENGTPRFTGADLDTLKKLPSTFANVLMDTAMVVNGWRKQDAEADAKN